MNTLQVVEPFWGVFILAAETVYHLRTKWKQTGKRNREGPTLICPIETIFLCKMFSIWSKWKPFATD